MTLSVSLLPLTEAALCSDEAHVQEALGLFQRGGAMRRGPRISWACSKPEALEAELVERLDTANGWDHCEAERRAMRADLKRLRGQMLEDRLFFAAVAAADEIDAATTPEAYRAAKAKVAEAEAAYKAPRS